MQLVALTAVFNGALTNVQQRSGSGLWLRFHIATIKQKMAIKDHRKRNKIPSEMEVAQAHKLVSLLTSLTLLILLILLSLLSQWLTCLDTLLCDYSTSKIEHIMDLGIFLL